jgi:D-3-phosphoglycerate dehydrogenase
MSFSVLLLDGVDPICAEIFESRGIKAVDAPKLAGAELLAEIGKYDGLVVRSATKVTKDLLAHAPNLKVVGRAGVGVDNIDIDACTEAGVLVMNTPDGNTLSTAEHACGLLLALARNLPDAVGSLKNGAWDRKKYMGTELHGKKLGVIGLGKIGSAVAQRMKAFGMIILGYDPFTTHEKAAEMGIQLYELDDVLKQADFLTVHTPLTEKTKGMISKANASKIKKGIKLVNCARGGIFSEEDLPELLDSGVVGGVALDVYTQEPPTEDIYGILKHPLVICTPHLGASTEEAQGKVAGQVAEQMADAFAGTAYIGSLNGKSIALSMNAEVQPYLKLAERLGSFVAQLAPKNCESISVEYAGDCAQYAEVLTDAVLKGFMAKTVDTALNLINARYYADQRGLKVRETSSKESGTFTDMVSISLGKEAAYNTVSATMFGPDDFRVVNIDGFGIELRLEGDIILYRNADVPGMLAAVSSALAAQNINIGALSLGRFQRGADAITAITVDKHLEEKELAAVSQVNGIRELMYIMMV